MKKQMAKKIIKIAFQKRLRRYLAAAIIIKQIMNEYKLKIIQIIQNKRREIVRQHLNESKEKLIHQNANKKTQAQPRSDSNAANT